MPDRRSPEEITDLAEMKRRANAVTDALTVSAAEWARDQKGQRYQDACGQVYVARAKFADYATPARIAQLVARVERAEEFREAMSQIDDVLFGGDSPSLSHLDAAAHAEPSNMARCYAAIHEIVVTAFRNEVAQLNEGPVVIDLMAALKASLRPDGQLRVCDSCGRVDALGVVTAGMEHYCGGRWRVPASTHTETDA